MAGLVDGGEEGGARESRDGWSLLTVETAWGEWGLKEYKWKGWFVGLVVPVQEILVRPVQNMFFLTEHYFNYFVPIAQQAGQPAVLGLLSFRMCLWLEPTTFRGSIECSALLLHCKKRLVTFPSPTGMSFTKHNLAGNNLNYSRPVGVW